MERLFKSTFKKINWNIDGYTCIWHYKGAKKIDTSYQCKNCSAPVRHEKFESRFRTQTSFQFQWTIKQSVDFQRNEISLHFFFELSDVFKFRLKPQILLKNIFCFLRLRISIFWLRLTELLERLHVKHWKIMLFDKLEQDFNF